MFKNSKVGTIIAYGGAFALGWVAAPVTIAGAATVIAAGAAMGASGSIIDNIIDIYMSKDISKTIREDTDNLSSVTNNYEHQLYKTYKLICNLINNNKLDENVINLIIKDSRKNYNVFIEKDEVTKGNIRAKSRIKFDSSKFSKSDIDMQQLRDELKITLSILNTYEENDEIIELFNDIINHSDEELCNELLKY